MIKLKTVNLEALDKKNAEHYILAQRLSEEKDTNKYISKRFFNWIEEPISKEQLEPGKTYIIKQKEIPIGIFGMKELNQHKILELWYTLTPENRGKKLGDKFLGEITAYTIENLPIEDLRLVIHKDNIPSIKIAKKNGYEEEDQKDALISYRYFNRK